MGSRAILMLLAVGIVTASCFGGSVGDSATDLPPRASADNTAVPPTDEIEVRDTESTPDEPTASSSATDEEKSNPVPYSTWVWTQVSDDAPWGRRAGLRVVELDGDLLLMGGRTPRQSTIPGDSDIFSDVWRSTDVGESWELIADGATEPIWPARSYFQALEHDGALWVLGGQDYGLMPNPFCELLAAGLEPPPGLDIDPDAPCPEFLPTSNFFNDVWRSGDRGVSWERATQDAPWSQRAGLSAVSVGDHMYVLGGSQNDDQSLIGPNGPQRLYFNDVWRSEDGVEWEQMTDAAPWDPRAGASVIERDGELWLFGGEDGFTCTPVETCVPPYFNDVWRSADGRHWTMVSGAAEWSPRPGHQCEVADDETFVCFGGFGVLENPLDVWASADGQAWTLLEGAPWNAAVSSEARYDFDSLTVMTDRGPVVLTFGGDRETFEFDDPDNWLRVDDDVWRFGPAD